MGKCLSVKQGHTDEVLDVCFDSAGTNFVSASADGTARVYSTRTGACLDTYVGHTGEVSKVSFNPQGTSVITRRATRLAGCGTSPRRRPREAEEEEGEGGRCSQVLEGHTDEIFSCAFNYEGTTSSRGARTTRAGSGRRRREEREREGGGREGGMNERFLVFCFFYFCGIIILHLDRSLWALSSGGWIWSSGYTLTLCAQNRRKKSCGFRGCVRRATCSVGSREMVHALLEHCDALHCEHVLESRFRVLFGSLPRRGSQKNGQSVIYKSFLSCTATCGSYVRSPFPPRVDFAM